MQKIVKVIISFIFIFILSACTKVDNNALNKIKDNGKLTIAVSPDYPPYEFYQGKNGKVEIVGADIALMESIAKKIGVELEIVSLSFDALLPALTSNRVDLVISGMNPTQERRQVIDFSNIYYVSGSAFIKRAEDNDVTNLNDLYRKKIAVQKGSIQETFLLEELKMDRNNIHALSDVTNVLQDLKNKQVDLAFLAEDVAEISLVKQPMLVKSQFKLDKDSESDGLAIGVKKGDNSSLLAVVNQVIDEYTANNQFENNIKYYAKIVADMEN